MAIDFVKNPKPEQEKKPKIDFYKPDPEEEYQKDKAKLEAEKAEFEKAKAAVDETKPKPFLRKKKINESVGNSQQR